VSLSLPLRQADQISVGLAAQTGRRIALETGSDVPSRTALRTVPGTVPGVTREVSISAAIPVSNLPTLGRLGPFGLSEISHGPPAFVPALDKREVRHRIVARKQ